MATDLSLDVASNAVNRAFIRRLSATVHTTILRGG
jgi:hypothetical protein